MGKLPRAVKMIASDELIGESLPKRPIIELCSDHRLYVERHLGVYEYSDVEIHIGVNFGRIIIRGGCLKLASMSKDSLVVTGQIQNLELLRG